MIGIALVKAAGPDAEVDQLIIDPSAVQIFYVAQAREMDLLTYLRTYEPQELVHFGGGTYCTREHDSLKISNGKWCWFSRGIGGYSALDYLIKVKEMPFTQAVETIIGNLSAAPPAFAPAPKTPKEKVLVLYADNRTVYAENGTGFPCRLCQIALIFLRYATASVCPRK